MSKTLATTAVRIAALALSKDRTAAHQCFRIKNLHPEEVVQLVECWPLVAMELGLQAIRLVVADSLGGRVPKHHVAEQGNSITHYRNNNRSGLIYVETSVQSDEQGLQNIFSLRDSNFLDGSFDTYMPGADRVQDLLVRNAWSGAGGEGAVPLLLSTRLLKVIDLVHPVIEPVPVRRFVAFSEAATRAWLAYEGVIDAPMADALVGRSLSELNMFPDEGWAQAGNEARLRRRLETNARHADMLDGVSELDADDIETLVERVRWRSADGADLQAKEAERWKQLCVEYARTRAPAVRNCIPYDIFSQLFAKDTAGLKLGEKIRTEIEQQAAHRLDEFDVLDLVAGLNFKNSADAARLLAADPLDGQPPLPALLTPKTRKSLERLAEPPRRRFFNPAIELVRLLQKVNNADTGAEVAVVRVELAGSVGPGSLTRGLFAFLYGDSLQTLSASLDGVPGTCTIEVADELTKQMPVPPLRQELEAQSQANGDVAEESAYNWEPLPFRFSFLDASGKIIDISTQMEWLPSTVLPLAFFWLLCCAPESGQLAHLGSASFDSLDEGEEWLRNFVNREVGIDVFRYGDDTSVGGPVPDSLAHSLLDLRQRLREGLIASGLSVELLRTYLDMWSGLLQQARSEYVPDGIRTPALDLFLATDLIERSGSERRLMSPVHPLRLRWICHYLERTRQLVLDFFSGSAMFADADGDYYLNWLDKLTPRESPPLCLGTQGTLLYSRSESGWWEDFSALSGGMGDLSFDEHSLSAVADRVTSYLDAHPYKRDGLSLLVVLPTSDAMPAQLLRKISNKANRNMRVSLHVAAPRSRWDAISRAVEMLVEHSDGSSRTGLFPDKDLTLLEMTSAGTLPDVLAELQLDIAIVTHVLQEQVMSQQNTEAVLERPGRFDPLQHRPLRLESSSGGGAVSMVLLPKYPDPMLESWSTLVVRAHRSRPVAPGQPDNTDLVELRVNFQDSARLFRDLHERCHWVITLERNISRQQIESVEAGAPDVLSIEDGVGANRLNTLVVSSSSGRDLVQSRLARKLRRLLPAGQDAAVLARGVYESIRTLAPRLALQALGVSRVTEEIVGVTVARNVAEEICPARLTAGFSAWLSLDERPDWFGGTAQVRADMCRIDFGQGEDGSVVVDLLVLEGKLRQSFDLHGVTQVQRSMDFFGSILGYGVAADVRRVDAQMWREQIASAIETIAPDALRFELGAEPVGKEDDLAALLLSRFRDGRVRIRQVQGLYCVCLWSEANEVLQISQKDGVIVAIASNRQLQDYLSPRCCHWTGVQVEESSVGGGIPPARSTDSQVDSPRLDPAPSPDDSSPSVGGDEEPIVENPTAQPLRRGLERAILTRMYQTVLGCFDQHGIRVTAAVDADQPIVEGPASILFKVKPAAGVDPRKLAEKAAALKLALELESDQNVNFTIDRGYVTVDVPKRPEQRYYVDAADTWTRWTRRADSLSIPLGEDRFGELVEIDFSSPNTPHLLVAGTTGSGKSEALNTILYGLVRHFSPQELRLMLVDPKGTELKGFEDSPFLEGAIGWDDADAIDQLKRAVEEMQRRYLLFKAAGHRSLAEYNAAVDGAERLPWWLVVLDEYADLTHDAQAKKDIEAELKRLAQKARSSGIHVIVATQKPSAEVISTNLRSNLPAQLVLRVKSATESRVVIDEAGGETLNGRGDALLKADGRLRRVQCSRVDLAKL